MQMNFLPLQDKYSVLVNFHRAVCALTSVLDFVGVDEILHGKRVACIAEAIAAKPGGICPAATFAKSITVGCPAPACSPQPQ